MRVPGRPEAAAAMLLGGIAVLHASMDLTVRRTQELAATAPRPLPAAGSSARKNLEWCLRNVGIVHDVYWASACVGQSPDDSPDCTLPDKRALPLNTARAQAEQQCLDEALGR